LTLLLEMFNVISYKTLQAKQNADIKFHN